MNEERKNAKPRILILSDITTKLCYNFYNVMTRYNNFNT